MVSGSLSTRGGATPHELRKELILSANDDVNARYTRARGALLALLEDGSTILNENQRRAADEATRLLGDVAAALEGGRDDEATQLLGDAEAALASATPTPTTIAPPATPPAPIPLGQPAPAPATPPVRRLGRVGAVIAALAGAAIAGALAGVGAVIAVVLGAVIAVVLVAIVLGAERGGVVGLTTTAVAAGLTSGLAASAAAGHIHVTHSNVIGVAIGATIATIGLFYVEIGAVLSAALDKKASSQRPQR